VRVNITTNEKNEIIMGAKFCGNCGEKIAIPEDFSIEDDEEIAASTCSAYGTKKY